MTWLDGGFTVGMPHMVPGQLSEVETFKLFGDQQWQAIASILGLPSQDIVNDQGERLYASFINVDVSLAGRTFRDFGEGARVHVRYMARVYARRFVEGVLLFDDAPIPDSAIPSSVTRDSLAATTVPHFYMTNAFVSRAVSNLRLRTFVPAGSQPAPEATVEEMPFGLRDHEAVQRSGEIAFPGLEAAVPLPGMVMAPITYEITPESDLNGAGLLYFARYIAIMNYGERHVLRGSGPVPISAPLIATLSTERRRIFYFANADADDSIRVQVSVHASCQDDESARDPTVQIPLRFHFVTELYRVSDGELMAKSVTRKALCLPWRSKGLVYEAYRLRRLWNLG
jgi:probable biosynthetic protein (TIGR04098 family)